MRFLSKFFSIESGVLLLSSVITLILITQVSLDFVKSSTIILQILIFLILVSKFLSKKISQKIIKTGFVFLSSIFIQLLVVSTGAFYSPFFILINLYTLGLSFLVNLSSAFIFLASSVLILVTYLQVNKSIQEAFFNDPGAALLNLASYIVIIPLAITLNQYYYLKDSVLKLLNKEINVNKQQQQSVLKGIDELVLTTDTNLNILSTNDAVEKLLNLSTGEVVNHNLLQIFNMKDSSGDPANILTLSIDKILADNTTRIIKDIYIYTKSRPAPYKVTAQISPIIESGNKVTQLSIILSNTKDGSSDIISHEILESSKKRQQQMADIIKEEVRKANIPHLRTQVELFSKSEDDLITALDLEDHPIKEVVNLSDIADLTKKALNEKLNLAQSLRVNLKMFLDPSQSNEEAFLALSDPTLKNTFSLNSELTAPVDARWLKILTQKLLDISLLLSSATANSQVEVRLLNQGNTQIAISILATPVKLKEKDLEELFKPYYGTLATTSNLKLGSGLEGFIAKTISLQLNLPIEVKALNLLPGLNFKILISKQPHL